MSSRYNDSYFSRAEAKALKELALLFGAAEKSEGMEGSGVVFGDTVRVNERSDNDAALRAAGSVDSGAGGESEMVSRAEADAYFDEIDKQEFAVFGKMMEGIVAEEKTKSNKTEIKGKKEKGVSFDLPERKRGVTHTTVSSAKPSIRFPDGSAVPREHCTKCGFMVNPLGHGLRCVVPNPAKEWIAEAHWVGNALLQWHAKNVVVQKVGVDEQWFQGAVKKHAIGSFASKVNPESVSGDLSPRGTSSGSLAHSVEAAYYLSMEYRLATLNHLLPAQTVTNAVLDESAYRSATLFVRKHQDQIVPSSLLIGFCYMGVYADQEEARTSADNLRAFPFVSDVNAYTDVSGSLERRGTFWVHKFPGRYYHVSTTMLHIHAQRFDNVTFSELDLDPHYRVGGMLGENEVLFMDCVDDIVANGEGSDMYRAYWVMLRRALGSYEKLVDTQFVVSQRQYVEFAEQTNMQYRRMVKFAVSMLTQLAQKTYVVEQLGKPTDREKVLDFSQMVAAKGFSASESPFLALPAVVLHSLVPGLVQALDNVQDVVGAQVSKGLNFAGDVRVRALEGVKSKL